MSTLFLPSIRNQAYRWIIISAAVACIISMPIFIFVGVDAGYSALLGGGTWVMPNFYMANRFFANVSAHAATQIIKRFYLSEVIKLFLIGILFIVIVKLVPLRLGYFFIGYLVAQITFWLTTLIALTNGKRTQA